MRSVDELATEICTLAGHINAANHRFLVLVAEFDRRKGWSDSGTQSCAHWLNWKCGIAMGAAREKVRVARALEHLPRSEAVYLHGSGLEGDDGLFQFRRVDEHFVDFWLRRAAAACIGQTSVPIMRPPRPHRTGNSVESRRQLHRSAVHRRSSRHRRDDRRVL